MREISRNRYVALFTDKLTDACISGDRIKCQELLDNLMI